MKKTSPLLICLSIFLCSWLPVKKHRYDLLIINAKIIDVEKGSVSKNKFIAISKDRISFIGDISKIDDYQGIKTIDAKNKFVMPGLWDNHVHFRGGETMVQENKNLLPIFLAYGITTVRDAGGDIAPEVLKWRKEINARQLAGPTIFSAGPKLDGLKPAWPGSIKVENQQDVMTALDSLQSIGVNFVKMYDGSLSAASFYSIIKEAKKRGLITTGHMPLSADILKAVDLGLNGSEHLYYVLKACSPKADSLTKLNLGYSMMGTLVDTYDPILAEKVYQKLAENKVSITPTLYVGQVLANVLKTNHSKDFLLPYMGKGIVKSYQGRIESAKRASAAGGNLQSKTERLFAQMIVPMQKAGVNLMAGSDCGASNSFVYPGESLHKELQLMVKAGLTPQQALQTSFVNGPKFFHQEKNYGSIQKGKIADVLILDENPFLHIENIDKINIVIARGQVYSKYQLAKMMSAVKPIINK